MQKLKIHLFSNESTLICCLGWLIRVWSTPNENFRKKFQVYTLVSQGLLVFWAMHIAWGRWSGNVIRNYGIMDFATKLRGMWLWLIIREYSTELRNYGIMNLEILQWKFVVYDYSRRFRNIQWNYGIMELSRLGFRSETFYYMTIRVSLNRFVRIRPK